MTTQLWRASAKLRGLGADGLHGDAMLSPLRAFFPERPSALPPRRWLVLPLLVYGLIMAQMMVRHDAPTEWPVLAAFVMGFPLAAAYSRLFCDNV